MPARGASILASAGGPLPAAGTPQQFKQQTEDALVAFTMEEAERQPVLEVWEDLQWADPIDAGAVWPADRSGAPTVSLLAVRP